MGLLYLHLGVNYFEYARFIKSYRWFSFKQPCFDVLMMSDDY
jgi:hypothetical protein